MIHGPARKAFTQQDWHWLEKLSKAGAQSILGFSFYNLQDWQRLLELGYSDLVLRCWHDRGSLPKPTEYHQQHASTIAYLSSLCRNHGARLAVAPINEANLELTDMSAKQVAAWCSGWVTLMRNYSPDVELLTPSLSPTHPGVWEYLQTIRSVLPAFDSISVHFYWQNDADLNPGAPWSPEWWQGQFPGSMLRITECGGADGTSRDWRYQTYYEMLSRYAVSDNIRSQHIFVMSADDDHWAQFGHTYDERIVEILAEVAKLSQVEESMPDDPQTGQLLNQNAELTAALIAHLKGNDWDGADSTAGHIIALTGKTLDELGLVRPLV